MPDPTDPPVPTDRLLKRKARPAEGKPPKTVSLAAGTVRLPKGGGVRLEKVAADTYRVVVDLPGRAVGERVPPPSIPAVKLTRAAVAAAAQPLDGYRPAHLPTLFAPKRVRLRPADRPVPPPGFVYRRGDEILDRPANIYPPDDRFVFQDTAFPWCTVGRVDTPLGTATGCTVGPNLLLTCGHAIQWNADGNGTAGWVRFRPAYYNGSAPFGEAWATEVVSWAQATGGDGLSDAETAFDYVVCVLDTRIGETVGFAGSRTYDKGWNGLASFQHIGYPGDLTGGERPAFVGGASVASAADHSTAGQTGYVMGHFNDITPGHSGGPLWGWWGDEPWPRVVGVQSAEAAVPDNTTAGDNEFGGGPALPALIQWARDNRP